MYQVPQITDSVYYVGVNDRMKERFENVWSIPSGVAYNAYLIVDEKTPSSIRSTSATRISSSTSSTSSCRAVPWII